MIKNWIVSIVIITTLVVGGVSAQHGRVGGLRIKRNLTPSGMTSGSSTRSSTKGDLFSKSQGSSTRSGGIESKAEKTGSGGSDRSNGTEAKAQKSTGSTGSTRSEDRSKAKKSSGSTRSGGDSTKSKTGAHRLFTKTEKARGSTRSGGGDAKAQKDGSGSNRSTNSAKTEKSNIVRW